MRLLLQRHDHQIRRAVVENAPACRGADPFGDERTPVPLRDVSTHHQSDSASGPSYGRRRMKLPRREFLKAGGALIVGFPLRNILQAQSARGTVPGPPDAKQVDTWLAIHADNTATVYIGFAELGQGASTSLL